MQEFQTRALRALRRRVGRPGAAGTCEESHASDQCFLQQPTFVILPMDPALQRPEAVSANGHAALVASGGLMLLLGPGTTQGLSGRLEFSLGCYIN